ncbi:MAG: hypothetical protein ACFFHV_20855 [Promethearchaeota archaeon]
MEKNPFKWPLAVIAAILVWCTDLFFNLSAYLLWPTGDFSPLTNWQSDLGNPKRNNPLGAQYYNCGQVFMGLAVILFVGGMYVGYTEEKWKNYLLVAGQFAGFLVGIGLIMNGIYSEELQPQHGQWSELIFMSITLTEFLINAALLKSEKFWKSIGYLGFIPGAINLFFVFTFDIFYPFAINIFNNEAKTKE